MRESILTEETSEETSEELIRSIYAEIITPPSFSLKQFKIFMLAFLTIMMEGIQLSTFSLMLIPVKIYFDLTDNMIIISSVVMFISFAVGSFFSGMVVHRIGRKMSSMICVLIICFLNIAIGFIKDIILFTILRVLIGFSLGILVPVINNILCEHLPIKYRSFYLTFVWVAFPCGQIMILLCLRYFMPNYETEYIPYVIWITGVVPFITLIYYIFCFEDSPRNILLTYHEDKSIRYLNKHYVDMSHDERHLVVKTLKRDMNKNVKRKLSEIFNRNVLCVTFIFMILWFFNSLTSYGLNLIYTLTMRSLGMGEAAAKPLDIINKQIIICLIHMPGYIFAGGLSEINCIGRKKSIALGYAFAAMCMFLATYYTEYFHIFFGLYLDFQVIPFNIGGNWAMEVYPTQIRDLALGFLYMVTRLGGCTSNILYIKLNDLGIFIPYYFGAICYMLCTFLTLLVPFETIGKPLDII
jgi:MFS family permease